MSIQKKILRSNKEPSNKNWLWLRSNNGVPELCEFDKGRWVSIVTEKDHGISNSVKPSTPSNPSTPSATSEYVTRDYFNSQMSKFVSQQKLDNILSQYALKTDIPDIPEIPDLTPINASLVKLGNRLSKLETGALGHVTSSEMRTYVQDYVRNYVNENLPNQPAQSYIENDRIYIVVKQNNT